MPGDATDGPPGSNRWSHQSESLVGDDGAMRKLEAYLEEMYARPRAPMRIATAFASIRR